MAESTSAIPEVSQEDIEKQIEEIEYVGRKHGPRLAVFVGIVAALWSLFQLWIASPFPFMFNFGIITDVPARGIHLAFAFLLCFLMFPAARSLATARIPIYDIVLAVLSTSCALYMFLGWPGLVSRAGVLWTWDIMGFKFPFEAILGSIGVLLLLEATRRSIGKPLVIVASVFLLYSYFGQSMPDIISHRGLSINRLIGYQWLGQEAIFGLPIDVSVSFVFLFVLFGALLDKAGAGKYFLDLSFAMVGKYRGGPAKAAILASGMTGAISGSSIANVVTTGVFTIPVMRKMGMSAVKAGAIEVAASTNGQLMPPIMGAAAFIIAELIGISYFEVVKAAFIPAVSSYIALIYISHLEAMKLGLKGMPKEDIPPLGKTFKSGLHYIVPIVVLVYLLMVERWTAGTAVFYSIMLMMIIMILEKIWHEKKTGAGDIVAAVKAGFEEIYGGLISGARNMVGIAIAVGTAGIIVGAVGSTGLNNALVGVIEAISGGNVYLLLLLTAVLSLILGMGLPTTANYLVVASLLAGVLVELGTASGLVLPLIAVHLFVFYFGILADDTPPVCLAAFAAAAISRADPIKTGLQGFVYDIRTAILPFIFIFNPELLLVGVDSIWHGLVIFAMTLLAMFSFSSLVQGWIIVKTTIVESLLLVAIVVCLFRPDFVMNQFFPKFATFDPAKFVAGEVAATPGYSVRFHLTRSTDYGDRFKLYQVFTPDLKDTSPKARYGIKLEPVEDDRFEVTNLTPKGLADVAGIEIGDYVTEFDEERVGQPPKELIYPVGLALIGIVLGLQLIRRRRQQPVPVSPGVNG
ncbi:MAG: TRAP transporter fused permease subunit [Alphaproteobacteria bacterium]|jgi:TRAP transporter 4TM/12TM fusion protein|nr:TRAP transporter fused permease subunit [Alphaproteobacteria bacterium]